MLMITLVLTLVRNRRIPDEVRYTNINNGYSYNAAYIFSLLDFKNRYAKVLGDVLPSVIIGMLVVYCLKDTDIIAVPHGFPELIAAAIVAGLQIWKQNVLVSILSGTVAYMLMVQLIFLLYILTSCWEKAQPLRHDSVY